MSEGYQTPIETRCATPAAAPCWAACESDLGAKEVDRALRPCSRTQRLDHELRYRLLANADRSDLVNLEPAKRVALVRVTVSLVEPRIGCKEDDKIDRVGDSKLLRVCDERAGKSLPARLGCYAHVNEAEDLELA